MHDERIRTCIETEFKLGGHRVKGKIRNVSEGGVFVGTSSIPEQGENVDLDFRAPGGGQVRLSGLVWWTTDDGSASRHRAPGFGLRLLEQNEEFDRFLATLQ